MEDVRDTGAEALWRACSSAIRVSIAPLIRFRTCQPWCKRRSFGRRYLEHYDRNSLLNSICGKLVNRESAQLDTFIAATLLLSPRNVIRGRTLKSEASDAAGNAEASRGVLYGGPQPGSSVTSLGT
jgi:hypothetical protein